MTTEEIIKGLESVKLCAENESFEWICQPIDKAIEALKRQPCEDAINRQAVLDKLNRLIEVERLQGTDEMGYGRERVRAYESMIFEIESKYLYPPVTPKPKTGHWEWVQYGYNSKLGDWHCSECKSFVIECVSKEEKGGIPLYKYCPQCGAKMVESQESEEKA